MSEEEFRKDILYQIDMQLYDEFNDKLAEMNDHLGDIYSLRDVEEVEKAEKEKEIKLLRETVRNLQKELDKKDKVINNLYEDIEYEYSGTNYLKSLEEYYREVEDKDE